MTKWFWLLLYKIFLIFIFDYLFVDFQVNHVIDARFRLNTLHISGGINFLMSSIFAFRTLASGSTL